MAGLVPAIHVFAPGQRRRGCPRQARARRVAWIKSRSPCAAPRSASRC